MINLLDAVSDGELTTSEAEGALLSVFDSAITGIVMTLSMKMFIDVMKPPKKDADKLMKISSLMVI